MVHKHQGHVQAKIIYYLINIHITKRTIYLTRVRTFITSLGSHKQVSDTQHEGKIVYLPAVAKTVFRIKIHDE